MVNVRKYSRWNSTHDLGVLDQWCCPQNVLEELGGKWLIPSNQGNTDIFVWVLLLQPNKPTIDCLTNFVLKENNPSSGVESCKIELLHLFFDPTSRLCRRRLIILFWHLVWIEILLRWCKYQPKFFQQMECRCARIFPRLGFRFCLWSGCNHFWTCWFCFLLVWTCKTSSVILDAIVHITNGSVRNSDPKLRIIIFHGFDSNFDSEFWIADNSSWPPKWVQFLVFSWIDPFASEAGSSRGRVYSWQATDFSRNSQSISCHDVLSNFYHTHQSCFLTKFTQSIFRWKSLNLLKIFAEQYWNLQILLGQELQLWPLQEQLIDPPILQVLPCYLAGPQIPRKKLPLHCRYWADWQKE